LHVHFCLPPVLLAPGIGVLTVRAADDAGSPITAHATVAPTAPLEGYHDYPDAPLRPTAIQPELAPITEPSPIATFIAGR
jgi:hypothetical protein